jgi:hypothetical protein
METNEQISSPAPGEENQPQEQKKNYGPLIGSEGEVSGYDWD